MQFIAHRPEGCAANPASLLASLIRFSRSGPLIVEPRQQRDRVLHIGDEHAIAVLRRIEQLILLWFVSRARLGLLLVAQGDEPTRFAPAVGLIAEFALAVSVSLRGAFPVRRFQLIDQPRCLARRNDE